MLEKKTNTRKIIKKNIIIFTGGTQGFRLFNYKLFAKIFSKFVTFFASKTLHNIGVFALTKMGYGRENAGFIFYIHRRGKE